MSLKNVLFLAFLMLTLIPIIVVSLLLYKSGFNLAKESYTRNLSESINVQADYISQAIESNMISDYRFAYHKLKLTAESDNTSPMKQRELLTAVQSYLESSEDKIAVCVLLDKDNAPIYTIGEKKILDAISTQIPHSSALTEQMIMEFDLTNGYYSLGIITPIWDEKNAYAGSLISIYDKSYIFKIISSYYKIVNTSTYICRENGDIINFRQLSGGKEKSAVAKNLKELVLDKEGSIDIRSEGAPITGYYKNIHNTPWHLIGVINDDLIYNFTNQFISIYIFIIFGVLIADVVMSFYFSRKVVEPINNLIKMMERYQDNLKCSVVEFDEKDDYVETKYLRSKFTSLMKTILLIQHNFEGMYQLYQSSDMDDTNIDIDVKEQTATSNKPVFQKLMNDTNVAGDACVVEKFIRCFCEKDQAILMGILEKMRDEHLSVTCEAEVYTPHLNQKWFHTLVVPMYEDDRLSRLFVQLRDISHFKRKEFDSLEQARRDALTGLFNRTGFADCVNKTVRIGGSSGLHGLLFIDMDFFKMVNDNLGHHAGDELLCTVSKILTDAIAPSGIASRFGGDEFAAFLPNSSMEAITEMAAKLKDQLVFPFATEKVTFTVSASIGVSVWDHTSPSSLDDILQQADTAMYQAKRQFKRRATDCIEQENNEASVAR